MKCLEGDPTPYTLHPTPYTLHPTPYTLHPTPYIPHHTPYTIHHTPYTIHPTPYTLHTSPHTLHPTPYTLHPTPNTPHAVDVSRRGRGGRGVRPGRHSQDYTLLGLIARLLAGRHAECAVKLRQLRHEKEPGLNKLVGQNRLRQSTPNLSRS